MSRPKPGRRAARRSPARLAILGAGGAGASLAVLAAAQGVQVEAIWSRDRRRARVVAGWIRDLGRPAPCVALSPALAAAAAPVILIAIPDAAMAAFARRLAHDLPSPPRRILLQLSGVHGQGILDPLRLEGHEVGSLHPLAVLTRSRPAPAALLGLGFAVDGTPRALRTAWRLALELGGRPYRVAERRKGRYHLAASLAANDVMALFHLAMRHARAAGLPERTARAALARLLHSAAMALAQQPLPRALTGPVVRGDAETLQRHFAAAGDSRSPSARVHRLLSAVLLDLARGSGRLSGRQAADLSRLLRAAGRD